MHTPTWEQDLSHMKSFLKRNIFIGICLIIISDSDWDGLLLSSRQLTDQGLLQMGSDLCSQSGSVIPREPFYLWWFVASRQALLGSSQSDPRLPFISWRLATRTLRTARCNDEPSSPLQADLISDLWDLKRDRVVWAFPHSWWKLMLQSCSDYWEKKTLFCPIFDLFQFTWWWELMRFWF